MPKVWEPTIVFDAIGAPGMEMLDLQAPYKLWAGNLSLMVIEAARTDTAILGLDYEVAGHTCGGQIWDSKAARRVRLERAGPSNITYCVDRDWMSGMAGTEGIYTLPSPGEPHE